MGCGILGFEFRYGQDVDMEGLDRSAETVVKLLLNEKTRGEIPSCAPKNREAPV